MPSTFVGPLSGSRTDASNIAVPSRQGLLQASSMTDASNITVPSRQGLLQVGNSEQRKVAFDKDVKNVYVPTMCRNQMYSSTPRFSVLCSLAQNTLQYLMRIEQHTYIQIYTKTNSTWEGLAYFTAVFHKFHAF